MSVGFYPQSSFAKDLQGMLSWVLKTESNHPELNGTSVGCCSEVDA